MCFIINVYVDYMELLLHAIYVSVISINIYLKKYNLLFFIHSTCEFFSNNRILNL